MKVCPMCLQDQSEKKSGTLIEDLKDFSSKMSSVIHFPSTIEVVEPGLSCSTMSSAIYDASNKEGNEKKHLSMIDNFAVFGVS